MNQWHYFQYQAALRLAKAGKAITKLWRPYSRLMIVRDYAGWSLDADAAALRACCQALGIRMAAGIRSAYSERQVLFLTSQFALLDDGGWDQHRICVAYFHGLPGTGPAEFDQLYQAVCERHTRISRIQVSHSEMHKAVLETGIEPSKVHRIPIAVDTDIFTPACADSRERMRFRLGIPQSAFLVGSFQKDGEGWGEGNTPKRIKGPDVFIDVVDKLRTTIPELFVLLTGPARGYVKNRLEALQIPYKHVFLNQFHELPPLYHALDLCLVTSRQEGGPKAVLESMASGIPLVTTRVGQAMDLVRQGENAFIENVEDVEGLVSAVERIHAFSDEEKATMLACARCTAEENAWNRQAPLWKRFFDGVVV